MDLNKHSTIDRRLNLAYDELELSSSATSTSGSFERENRFAGTFVETTLPKQVETLNCGIPEDMQQSSSSSVDEQLLIVEQETTDKDRRYTREKTYLLSALKCILSIFMSIALFICVVAGKISLVHIGQQLNYTATKENVTYIVNDNSASLRETSFIMLIIIMIFPSLYSLLRAICISGMKSSHPWPTQRAIIWVSKLALCCTFLKCVHNFCRAVAAPKETGNVSPRTLQLQFSNSSKFEEKIPGLGWGTSSNIVKWM